MRPPPPIGPVHLQPGRGGPPGENWPEGWLPWCIRTRVKNKDPALLQRSLFPDMVLLETSPPNISELNTWKINSVLQELLVIGIQRSLSSVAFIC